MPTDFLVLRQPAQSVSVVASREPDPPTTEGKEDRLVQHADEVAGDSLEPMPRRICGALEVCRESPDCVLNFDTCNVLCRIQQGAGEAAILLGLVWW